MSRAAPPLWSWALAATLAALILAALALDPIGDRPMVADLDLARLRTPTDAAPLIVLIGSSKLRCAVDFDEEIAGALKARGVTARVVRIAYPGADYRSLRPAFAALQAARPAVVLVEEDLLLQTWSRAALPAAQSWRPRARRALRLRLGLERKSFNAGSEARAACGAARPKPITPNDLADYRHFLAALHTSSAADRALYLKELARLRSTGTKTGLINLTRSPAAAAIFPVGLGAEARQALAGTPGLVLLTPPRPYPQSAYADLGHLNAEGRRLYTAWLIPRLVGLVGPDHD